MKPARVEKLERRREVLEGDYREALIDALQQCANGTWGLFGRNELAHAGLPDSARKRLTPEAVGTLSALEDEIASVRDELGYSEPFALAQRLAVYREYRGQNDLGEPRLAAQFLEELKVSE